MVSPLEGSIAKTVNKAFSKLFLSAVLTREVRTNGGPLDEGTTSLTTFTCRALDLEYGASIHAQGFVADTDVNIMILADSLATEPQPLDRIAINRRGITKTFVVVPASTGGMQCIKKDPANATWECRASRS